MLSSTSFAVLVEYLHVIPAKAGIYTNHYLHGFRVKQFGPELTAEGHGMTNVRNSNKLENLLLGVIFLLPLLRSANNFGYEEIKVLFFIVSITLIGLFYIKQQIKFTVITIIAGLFILTLWVTSISGINPMASILGTQPYFQGAILYSYLFLFFLIIKFSNFTLKTVAKVISISAIFVGSFAIYDWILLNIFNFQIPTYAGRVVSTFGQPNFYAGFLLITLPFSYLLFKNSTKKLQILGWVSGMISFIGIIVSYSRSAIFLALTLLVIVLIYQLSKRFRIILTGVIFILICAVFISIKYSSGFFWKEFLLPTTFTNPDLTKQSVESRVYIWPQAFKIALQKPISGYGLENMNFAFSNYFQVNKHVLFEENLNISPILISLKDLNLIRSHNYLLDLFIFSGFLGLLTWFVLIVVIFWKGLKRTISIGNSVLLCSFLLYLIWVQFQNQSVIHLIYFWLLVGLIDQDKLRT